MIVPNNLSLNYYELILTENCNLRCTYCYDSYYSERKQCSYKSVMDSDFMKNFVPFVLETYDRNSEILFSFFGGEPTMNWEFIEEFVNEAKKHFKFPYTYTINTNAILLNSKRIDFLVENQFYLGVSLDGTEEAHNINRKTIDNSNSWTDTIKKLPEIIVKSRKFGREVNVLMVITENNQHLLTESYEFLMNLGIEINLLFDYVYDMSDELLNSIKKQLEYLFIEKRYPLPIEFNRRVLRNGDKNPVNNYCFIPNKNVSISPEGKLFFCHQLVPKMSELNSDFKEYYGDIVNGYTEVDYYNKMMNRVDFNQFKKINKKCQTCRANTWCAGGCIAGHKHYTKDYDKLNINLCKLNLIIHDITYKINK